MHRFLRFAGRFIAGIAAIVGMVDAAQYLGASFEWLPPPNVSLFLSGLVFAIWSLRNAHYAITGEALDAR